RRHAGSHRDARRPPRTVARLDIDPLDQRMRQDFEIRPPESRPQERLRRAPAHAAPLVHLEVGVAEIVATVELRNLRDPALLRRFAPRIEDLPADAALLDAQLAARPVKLVGAVLIVLRALEYGQHVVPGPPAVAELGPVVVVAALPAHVDHRVDRRAAA